MFHHSFSISSLLKSIMPGLEYFTKRSTSQPSRSSSTTHVDSLPESKDSSPSQVYSNPRLNPSNYLHGPLSWNPATRLRQLLARPGIVVAPGICDGISARCALEAGFECLYQRYLSSSFNLPITSHPCLQKVGLPQPLLASVNPISLSLL